MFGEWSRRGGALRRGRDGWCSLARRNGRWRRDWRCGHSWAFLRGRRGMRERLDGVV